MSPRAHPSRLGPPRVRKRYLLQFVFRCTCGTVGPAMSRESAQEAAARHVADGRRSAATRDGHRVSVHPAPVDLI